MIHRDIKPDNFTLGLNNNQNTVYLIDYGLANRYIDPLSKRHITFNVSNQMVGTLRYCSLNSHTGAELSRRDDIESLGYTLIYMLKGRLPWQGMKASKGEEHQKIVFKRKSTISIIELCRKLPIEVAYYIEYCRGLNFDEKPSYKYLHDLLRGALAKLSISRRSEVDLTASQFSFTRRGSNEVRCHGRNFSRRIKEMASKLNFAIINIKKKEIVNKPKITKILRRLTNKEVNKKILEKNDHASNEAISRVLENKRDSGSVMKRPMIKQIEMKANNDRKLEMLVNLVKDKLKQKNAKEPSSNSITKESNYVVLYK